MRNLLYLTIIVLALYSCNSSHTAKISGKLENAKPGKVYIEELTLTGKEYKDSATISGSGRFKLTVNLEDPGFYRLRIGSQRGLTLILRPKDRLDITGDGKDLYANYLVEGSDESGYAQSLDRHMDKTTRGIDSINQVYRQFLNNPNIANITKVLQNNYFRLLDDQRKFTIDFIEKHPASLASIMALYQQTDDSVFVLYRAEDVKYYSMVDSLLFPKYPKTSYVKALHNNLDNIKSQLKQQEMKKIMSALGSPAQDFSLPDASGKSISLSSFKGNPVILYFWASWSDTCRKDDVELLKVYEKYKAKGLKILAVSLDMNKEVWQNAINKDKITAWTHVSDLKYWNSPVVGKYNIERLPLSFLIDKDGTILSRSYNSNGLDNRLELYFKK